MNETAEPRSHWQRNIFLAFLGLLITGFVVHAIWSMCVSSQLRFRISSLQQAGEPILPEDFNAKVPDGSDNAAFYLAQASQLVSQETETSTRLDRLNFALPLQDNERQIIRSALIESEPLFRLIDTAIKQRRCEWFFDLRTPVLGRLLPELNGVRKLATRLSAAAMLAHDGGDEATALRRIDEIVSLSRMVDREPTLVSHLVATGIVAMASFRAREISCELQVGTGGAAREQVQALIVRLLDDRPPTEGFELSMRAERMQAVDTIRALRDGIPVSLNTPNGAPLAAKSSFARYLFKPILESNAVALIDYMGGMIHVAEADTFPGAREAMPALPAGVKNNSPTHLLASILLPSLERVVETQYRCNTERRLSATALAIGWYRFEHNGALPATLNDLVPTYLPSVPNDPMSADNRTLGYKPATTKPILYGVGTNGTDEGGDESPLRRQAQSPNEWERHDLVIHLTRQPRPPRDEAE